MALLENTAAGQVPLMAESRGRRLRGGDRGKEEKSSWLSSTDEVDDRFWHLTQSEGSTLAASIYRCVVL